MKINYQKLEKKLNIKFKNNNLLIQSLTHKSFNPNENNEKIEFLGDRVLGLVIAQKLLKIYHYEKEGILDKKFSIRKLNSHFKDRFMTWACIRNNFIGW